jgi:uroporphyrinogen decarboxylase
VPVDGVHFWEDICFNSGPIISPAHFQRMVVPRYRRIADLAMSYGYDRISVDSDGNLWPLLEGWLDGGVNLIMPIEVQAGMDVNALQHWCQGRAAWMGGIHKSRLADGEKAVAQELERIRPALERGGYVPGGDHNLVPEISLEDYLTYLRLRRDVLGLGRGGPDRAHICRKQITRS